MLTVAPGACLDKAKGGPYRTPTVVPQDCFADEVAIDFPSVGRLVQRMRATFFAENPGSDVEYHANVWRSEEPLSRRLSPPRRSGPKNA